MGVFKKMWSSMKMCIPCMKCQKKNFQENVSEMDQESKEEEEHQNEAPEMEFFNSTPQEPEKMNEALLSEIKDGNKLYDSELETTNIVDQENETPEMELHFLEVNVDIEQENETPEMEFHFLEPSDVVDVREAIDDHGNETPDVESHILDTIDDLDHGNETPDVESHIHDIIDDLDQENETPDVEFHILEIVDDIIFRAVSSSESKNLNKVVKNFKILKRTLFLSRVYDSFFSF